MEQKVSLIESMDHKFLISSKDFEFAYIRNIFESKNLYQVVVMLKGCHDVEPFKEGIVIATHDTPEEAEQSMKKLVRGMIDTTGLEVVHI